MLERGDFDQAGRVELALTLAGAPGRVVGHQDDQGADCWGIVLQRPRRGSLGTLAAALGSVLGAPVKLVRRGAQLLVLGGRDGIQ
jgi:hypothetical protein